MKTFSKITCALIALQLVGCGSDPVVETQLKIQEIESSVKATPVKDAAVVDTSPVFYMHDQTRDPFVPESLHTLLQKPSKVSAPVNNPNRIRSVLEDYNLTELYFIGVVKKNGKTLGLIETPQKSIFTVYLGSYVGNSNGRVSKISKDGIQIIEVRPNGVGGYYNFTQNINAKPGVAENVDQYGGVIQQNANNSNSNVANNQQFMAQPR